jgi:hypothetical protein
VTFRVTSAATLLLEPVPAKRAEFRKRLQKAYDSRSTVVHGGSVNGAKLQAYKELAIGTAVACLRTLFESHPHLIPDRERGIKLMLRNERHRRLKRPERRGRRPVLTFSVDISLSASKPRA